MYQPDYPLEGDRVVSLPEWLTVWVEKVEKRVEKERKKEENMDNCQFQKEGSKEEKTKKHAIKDVREEESIKRRECGEQKGQTTEER